MKLDLTAAELFCGYLSRSGGLSAAADLLEHPAYQAVRKHAEACYGVRLCGQHVVDGLGGEASPFFGLRRVRDNLPRILEVLEVIRKRADSWLEDAAASLNVVAPGVDLSAITVYPIVGYDAGIGIEGSVCLNLNWGVYLDRPEELLYMMIHEATHVLYGRRQPLFELSNIDTYPKWLSLFRRMTQDEGFAVYAPLALRMRRGATGDESSPILRDYQVLLSPGRMAWHLERFRDVARWLASGLDCPGDAPMSADAAPDREECMLALFGPHRLTYRTGCELVRRIEQAEGGGAVAAAFNLNPEQFTARYGGLVGVSTGKRQLHGRPRAQYYSSRTTS